MLHDLVWLSEIDWTYPHAAVTVLCAVVSLWLMQHFTQQACFATGFGRYLMMLRISLALMSLALAFNGYLIIRDDISPWWPDTLCRVLLLFTLLTIPAAMSRYRRYLASINMLGPGER